MSNDVVRATNITAVYAADSGRDVPAVDDVTLEGEDTIVIGQTKIKAFDFQSEA